MEDVENLSLPALIKLSKVFLNERDQINEFLKEVLPRLGKISRLIEHLEKTKETSPFQYKSSLTAIEDYCKEYIRPSYNYALLLASYGIDYKESLSMDVEIIFHILRIDSEKRLRILEMENKK